MILHATFTVRNGFDVQLTSSIVIISPIKHWNKNKIILLMFWTLQ